MTGLLDLTAELPVWAVAVAGLAAFLLGLGARQSVGATPPGCARCRTVAAHRRRIERPARAAWPRWPGRPATSVPINYGTQPLQLEPPPETEDTDEWPLDSPIPVPPSKRAVPTGTGKLAVVREGPLRWAWQPDDTDPWSAVALPDVVHPRSLFPRPSVLDLRSTTTQMETLA